MPDPSGGYGKTLSSSFKSSTSSAAKATTKSTNKNIGSTNQNMVKSDKVSAKTVTKSPVKSTNQNMVKSDKITGSKTSSKPVLSYDAKYSSEKPTNEKQKVIYQKAKNLGISPLVLTEVIGYETIRTFSPSIRGGKDNKYIGLIQFGPAEQKKYGVNTKQTFVQQMDAVESYLKDRGVKSGMGALNVYAAINAGNATHVNARDMNGTEKQHVERLTSGIYKTAAEKFLYGDGGKQDVVIKTPQTDNNVKSKGNRKTRVSDEVINPNQIFTQTNVPDFVTGVVESVPFVETAKKVLSGIFTKNNAPQEIGKTVLNDVIKSSPFSTIFELSPNKTNSENVKTFVTGAATLFNPIVGATINGIGNEILKDTGKAKTVTASKLNSIFDFNSATKDFTGTNSIVSDKSTNSNVALNSDSQQSFGVKGNVGASGNTIIDAKAVNGNSSGGSKSLLESLTDPAYNPLNSEYWSKSAVNIALVIGAASLLIFGIYSMVNNNVQPTRAVNI